MNRYIRQEQIIGTVAQVKLANRHVLVVGAGGLGCPVLQYLAGAGVGQITLIDHDIVEESNLHRQPLYQMYDLTRPKVLAAADHIKAAHPSVYLNPLVRSLTPSITKQAISTVDMVIDAADSFAVSYMLSDACFALGTPLISASALGRTGYAGVFCGGGPSLRAVFPELPEIAGNCASDGVLGPVVGMVGTLQAQLALGLLTDQSPSPLSRLITINMNDFSFGGFSFANAPEPENALHFIDRSMIDPDDQLIELRPKSEVMYPFAEHARRVLPKDILNTSLNIDKRVVLACKTGVRAWKTAKKLMDSGYNNIVLFAAGGP